MIPKDCKRLAEVDFPIAEVSKHAAREKSIRHGHPSTLHLWWARRPLASCRAVLLTLLLPDPCDSHCPPDFKLKARELLPRLRGTIGPKDEDLRREMLRFIEDFANWDNSAEPTFLEVGRGLVKAAHPEEPPLVVDPFAGGGSIPLEALRLGCEAFASDLNPVACLILKVMLEDIPRHGPKLAEELRRVGGEIKKQAEKELAEFYPRDPDGATPIAYLWARTVRCEAPNCGAEIPLARSFWLCKKPKRKRALRPIVHHRDTEKKEEAPCPLCLRGEFPHIAFEIFEPKADKDVPGGTVTRAKATCVCCGTVLPPERVRAQLAAQRGGADAMFHHRDTESTEKNHGKASVSSVPPWCRTGGARLLAVVTLKPGEQGRNYRLPTERDYEAVWKAQKRLKAILDEWERAPSPQPSPTGRGWRGAPGEGLCPVPDEPLPKERQKGSSGFRVLLYGMRTFGDLFTVRQKVVLVRLLDAVNTVGVSELIPVLACALNRVTMSDMSCTRWNAVAEKMQHTFGRQALPIVWDFAEVVVTADAPGNWKSGYELIADVIDASRSTRVAQTQAADATGHPLPDETAGVWFTDPPYYDSIAYADLSDFFFVWLKRTLLEHPLLHDPFDSANPLTPKRQEVIQDPARGVDGVIKNRDFYEEAMARAFAEGRRVLREDGVGAVIFAHKTTEGWEALLSGMIRGGWTITGSWPIATEMGSRLLARESAALATSVHLICRPRPDDAPVGDWGEVLRELPRRVGDWMERLQNEGIRGADLVFACIGPALEIFSRYAKVETAEGREVSLAEYLEKVWEVVGRTALEQVLGTAEAKARNGAAGAVEEDARLTALFLWTLQSTNGEESHRGDAESAEEEDVEGEEDDEGVASSVSRRSKGFSLVFDVVRRFAQPLGIDLPKWEGRIIETHKGVVRLLSVSDRARQLFGKDGAQAIAERLEEAAASRTPQLSLFAPEDSGVPKRRSAGRKKGSRAISDEDLKAEREATTLDRIHMAMLLQASGRANALRALLKDEQGRGPDFLRLANALSALYPKSSEEKRLLDAMLLAVPR